MDVGAMRHGKCQSPGGPTAFLLWGRDARDEARIDLTFVCGRTGLRRHLAWLLSFVGTLVDGMGLAENQR